MEDMCDIDYANLMIITENEKPNVQRNRNYRQMKKGCAIDKYCNISLIVIYLLVYVITTTHCDQGKGHLFNLLFMSLIDI